jgi:hypothetical protein
VMVAIGDVATSGNAQECAVSCLDRVALSA